MVAGGEFLCLGGGVWRREKGEDDGEMVIPVPFQKKLVESNSNSNSRIATCSWKCSLPRLDKE